MNHFTGSRAMMQAEVFDNLSKPVDTMSIVDEVIDIDRVISKIVLGAKPGEVVTISGGKGLDLADFKPVDMITILDGDILENCGHDRVNEVMKNLSKTAQDLGCIVVLDNGTVLVDIESHGFTEKFREFRELGRKYRRFGRVAGFGTAKLFEEELKQRYEEIAPGEDLEYNPIHKPTGPKWKESKLRRGLGHNKHSRKGKKK